MARTKKSSKTTKKIQKKIEKSISSSVKRIIAVVAFTLVASFIILCYFRPDIYTSILNLFNEKPKNYVTKIDGDDIYVEKLLDTKVHFVNVGQGDSIIIQLPDGSNMLIDAFNDDALIDYAKNKLNITTFNYVIATHSHDDHIDAMDEVFDNFIVQKVFRPYVKYKGDNDYASDFNLGGSTVTTDVYDAFLTSIKNETYFDAYENKTKPCEWEFFNCDSDFAKNVHYNGQVYTYSFDFLTPTSDVEDIKYSNLNDYSPFVKFTYLETEILFTGDAEEDALNELLSKYSSDSDKAYLDVDVLKVGHHGSRTSTTTDFLKVIKPEYAIISCGTGNSYYHPHQEVLHRFLNGDVKLFRTDLNGNIVLTIGQSEIDASNFTLDVSNKYTSDNMYIGPTKN